MSEYLDGRWRDILGVDITWEILKWSVFLDRFYAETAQATLIAWLADYPDADSLLRAGNVPVATRWRNEAYEALVEQARRVTDQQKRMKLCQEADRVLIEEAAIIPLVYDRSHLLVKPWVRKYPVSALARHFWKDVIMEPH